MAHSTQVNGKSKWQLHFTHLWGRDYGHNNDWFSLLPENWWLIDDEGDDFRLRYYIKMIYDFQPKNQ